MLSAVEVKQLNTSEMKQDIITPELLAQLGEAVLAQKALPLPAEILVSGELDNALRAIHIQLLIASKNIQLAEAQLANTKLDVDKLANARAALAYRAAAEGRIDLSRYNAIYSDDVGELKFVLKELLKNDNPPTNQP